MCRWFAYLAPANGEECLLEDVLITPDHSLAKQIHNNYLPHLISTNPGSATTEAEIEARNKFLNVDGFGVVWYTNARAAFTNAIGPRPVCYRNDQPPNNDEAFNSICRNTFSTAVLGHIRSATATSVVIVNSHPFVFGRHSIMHNGVVASFVDIKLGLLGLLDKDVFEHIKGTTDSEHLAALYMTCLTRNSGKPGKAAWEDDYPVQQMADALTEAVSLIFALQQKILGRGKAEANSLNVCCADGRQMVGLRLRNHATEQPPSLYWSNTAGVTLNRKYPDHPDAHPNPYASRNPEEHGKHMIIASEPTTYKMEEWHLIEKNHVIKVAADGNHESQAVVLPANLLATAKTTQHG